MVIRVNSPGGSVLAADRLFYAIERLKKAKKLVYTSMGNMATSGGYYIALSSDKIYILLEMRMRKIFWPVSLGAQRG